MVLGNIRNANLRYRPARIHNRRKPEGWLAPSLQHRVDGVANMVKRLRKLAPVKALAVETVRFDTQLLQNPNISGVEYQQGTLAGYEVREYLLEKWGRRCAYCGAKNVPLQIDHIEPKIKGGSDRISNLTLACGPCNTKKGGRPIQNFLKRKTDILKRILAQAKAPLRDAAAVNSTRWAVWRMLRETGLHVESSTGERTKWNRSRFGFQTGDQVKGLVPSGKNQGAHVGRVANPADRQFLHPNQFRQG